MFMQIHSTDFNIINWVTVRETEADCGFTSAMRDSLKTIKFKPRVQQKHDLRLFLHGKKKLLLSRLNQELAHKKGIK